MFSTPSAKKCIESEGIIINKYKSNIDKPSVNSGKTSVNKVIIILLLIVIKAFVLYKYTNLLDMFKSTESLIKEVISNNENAVVQVLNFQNNDIVGSGSGVVYSKDNDVYYIVTNEHVISSSEALQVRLYDKSVIDASVYKTDADYDLAIIKIICNKKLPILKSNSKGNNLVKGQIVVSIGTPINDSYYNTATTGIISNLSQDLIQHSCSINPGNSGGALFNLRGQLIGINTSKVMTASSKDELIYIDGISLATNISLVKKLFS